MWLLYTLALKLTEDVICHRCLQHIPFLDGHMQAISVCEILQNKLYMGTYGSAIDDLIRVASDELDS